MDLEKIYKDFNWHPSDGDYNPISENDTGKKNDKSKIQINKFIIFSVLIIFIVIGILIYK